MMLNDAYDAHDMLISQAFKEPDPSSKDGNLQQQENNRYKEKMNNREMLIALYIHKGRKVIQPRSAEYSQSTKKKNPIQQAWR